MTQAEANQLLDQFKAVYSGQKAEYYGFLGECLSLDKRWLDALINKSVPGLNKGKQQAPASGNGKGSGYYTNFANLPALHPYFTPEPWNPAKTYPRGSMVVYSPTSHIAIYENSGATAATVFEQNADPDSSAAHTAQRGNTRIDGILVLKVDAPPAPQPTTQGDPNEMITTNDEATKLYRMLRPNSTIGQGELDATVGKRSYKQFLNDAQREVDQRDAAERAKDAQLVNLSSQLASQSQAITDLTEKLKSSETTNAEKQKALNEAVTTVTKTTAEMTAIHDQLTALQQQPEVATIGVDSSGLLTWLFSFLVRKKSK